MDAGELQVVAIQDLGGLGAEEGPPVLYAWSPPSSLPKLVPWVVVLFLLLVPMNRRPAAWVALAPLVLVPAGDQILGVQLTELPSEALDILWAPARALLFGLAAIWLLLPVLGGSNRFLAFLKTWLALTGTSLLFFLATAPWNAVPETFAAVFLLGIACPSLVGALALAGRFSRKRYSEPRLLAWLLVWLTAAISLVFVPIGLFAALVNDENILGPMLLAVASLAGSAFALLAPWVLLSWAVSFYRDRLRQWLHVHDSPAPPPVSVPLESAPLAAAPQSPV